MNKWKRVSTNPPEDGQRCIIFTRIYVTPDHIDECNYREGMELTTYYKDIGFMSENGMDAKYWMPAPEEPCDANIEEETEKDGKEKHETINHYD